MTKFSNKLKKPCFWPIFPNLGQKKYSQNNRLSRTTSYEFLAPHQISEKTNDTIAPKRLDRRMDKKTGRSYFIGPFQLLLGSNNVDLLISYGAVLIFVQLIGIKILMQVSLLYKDKISSNSDFAALARIKLGQAFLDFPAKW